MEPAGPTTPGADDPARPRWRARLLVALQLSGLFALAVAQPLFDLLGRSPEFFAVNGVGRTGVLLFAAALTALPLLVLALVTLALGLLPRRAMVVADGLLVGGFAALLVLLATNDLDLSPIPIALAAVVALFAAAALYVRASAVSQLLVLLSPAPLVFAGLFLLASPTADLLRGEDEARAQSRGKVGDGVPVVLVVFDELPVVTLMDPNEGIDARRFPNFARLAQGSTWYRNTTTVSRGTVIAMPALLSGRVPRAGKRDRLPVAGEYPDSLFSLLGGYDMNVIEPITRLCPPSRCPRFYESDDPWARSQAIASDASVVYAHLVLPRRIARRLPPIDEGWGGFRSGEGVDPGSYGTRRLQRMEVPFEGFLKRLRPAREPRLHVLHQVLPHRPWELLPNGQLYPRRDAIGAVRGRWGDSDFLPKQGYQRHLMQAAYTDEQLGRILDRMQQTGLYDDALLVVASDHGVSFHPRTDLRDVGEHIEDTALVPLFVKLPAQRQGRTDDTPVRTVDIVPTIADVTKLRLSWKADGSSLLSRSRPSSDTRTMSHERRNIPIPDDILERRRAAVLRRHELFGATGFALRGYSVTDLPASAPPEGASAHLREAALLRDVDPRGPGVPALLTGTIEGVGEKPPLMLQMVVNGQVAGFAESWADPVSGEHSFAVMIDPDTLRLGRNTAALRVVQQRTTFDLELTG